MKYTAPDYEIVSVKAEDLYANGYENGCEPNYFNYEALVGSGCTILTLEGTYVAFPAAGDCYTSLNP